MGTPFVHRVVLRNYKSIAKCDVQLGPLTFLVGANGSGKSNFVDALRFVAEALRSTLDHALRERGGVNEVRRRSGGHPTNFGIRLGVTLPSGEQGYYAFEISAVKDGGYVVKQERCELFDPRTLDTAQFRVMRGEVISHSWPGEPPPASADRLYLVNVSGLPFFRGLYEELSHMGFYSFNPTEIRELQSPDPGDLLARDGKNITSVLRELGSRSPAAQARIQEYLAQVVPGVHGVAVKSVGPKDTLEFRQDVAGSSNPWRFPASSMSDGTLRVLATLVALFQSSNGGSRNVRTRVPLVALEEPETALHPAAVAVLVDGLRDASERTQVLVTSHSPDLIEAGELGGSSIRVVVAERGTTLIAPLDAIGRRALHEHLYTAGELLRLDQLRPDPKLSFDLESPQLFGSLER